MNITVFGKAVKPLIFVITIAAVFFGSLFIFDMAGIYQVTVPALETIAESGNHLKIVDLRGSMSIETGAKYVGMDLPEFYALMEIPDSVPKETLLKAVVNYVPGYDFHVIKASR